MEYKQELQDIIRLLDEEAYLKLEKLSIKTSIPERRIRTAITYLDPETTGVEIESKIGYGYRKHILDHKRYQQFITEGNRTDERTTQVLQILLGSKDYITIDKIAEQIHQSRATVDRLLPQIRSILAEYKLDLKSKPKVGVWVSGSEDQKRLCLAREISRPDLQELHDGYFKDIQQLLYDLFQKEDYEISDYALINLAHHLAVALARIRQGQRIHEETQFPKLAKRHEFKIAAEITSAIEDHFHVHFQEQELYYITMHLMGKRLAMNETAIDPMIYACIERILDRIKEEKKIDLTGDEELKTALSLHILPLLSRMKFGIQMENPISRDIKREMNRSWRIALLAKNELEKMNGDSMSDDEVGLLATHFAVALDKQIEAKRPHRFLVVRASSGGIARLLRYRLMDRLHIQEEDIELVSLFHLDEVDFSRYTCILSTVELWGEYPIPVIYINVASSDEELIQKIDAVVKDDGLMNKWEKVLDPKAVWNDCSFTGKDEILRFMAEKMIEIYGLEEDFLEKIFERERLSSTEVGNFVAYPHPPHYSGEVFLAVMTLKRPILWEKTKVRYIFMIATPELETEWSLTVDRAVTGLICDPERLSRLKKNATWSDILSELRG